MESDGHDSSNRKEDSSQVRNIACSLSHRCLRPLAWIALTWNRAHIDGARLSPGGAWDGSPPRGRARAGKARTTPEVSPGGPTVDELRRPSGARPKLTLATPGLAKPRPGLRIHRPSGAQYAPVLSLVPPAAPD